MVRLSPLRCGSLFHRVWTLGQRWGIPRLDRVERAVHLLATELNRIHPLARLWREYCQKRHRLKPQPKSRVRIWVTRSRMLHLVDEWRLDWWWWWSKRSALWFFSQLYRSPQPHRVRRIPLWSFVMIVHFGHEQPCHSTPTGPRKPSWNKSLKIVEWLLLETDPNFAFLYCSWFLSKEIKSLVISHGLINFWWQGKAKFNDL